MVNKLRASRYTLFLVALLLFCLKSQAQNSAERLRALRDSSLGVVISPQKFDSLVSSLLIKFKSDTSEKKMEDYILMVKVCNTIGFDQLVDSSKIYKELFNLYNLKYVKTIAEATDATISIGYSYYSKKYDLQIGGIRTKNNFFKIVR